MVTVATGGGLFVSAVFALLLFWTKIVPLPVLAVLALGVFLISAGISGRLV